LVAPELGARHRTGDVRTAARFAEQLAPDILASQNAEQEFLLLQIGAVRENSRGGEGADADLSDADRTDAIELLLDRDGREPRQS
jgi:hypothetical protein